MYQVSCVLGKSTGFDVSILQVPIATAMAASSVGFNIGETTTLTYGQIMLRCKECMQALIEDAKQGGGLNRAQMNPATAGKSGIVHAATNALTAEAAVAAVATATGGLDGQTGMMYAALVQCLEVFRETVLTGGLTIKP